MQIDEYKVLKKVISEDLTPDRKKSLRELKREILVNICQNKRADITLSLSNMDLSGVNLSKLDLSGADLTSTNLCGAILDNTNLHGANLNNTQLNKTSMFGTNIKEVNWENSNTLTVKTNLSNIPLLPISDNEKYIMLEAYIKTYLGKKTYQEEMQAVDELRHSLTKDNEIQKRLANLDNSQLQIVFSCLYTNASFRLNPLITGHLEWEKHAFTKNGDANTNLIKGYANFLTTLNQAFISNGTQNKQEKTEHLVSGIKELSGLLVNNSECLPHKFSIKKLALEMNTDKLKELDGGKYELTTPYLKHTVGFEIDYESRLLRESLEIKEYTNEYVLNLAQQKKNGLTFTGLNERTAKNIEHIYIHFAEELISAYENNDILKIFGLTLDFENLLLLPDENDHVSQVIRDCFALYLGELPFYAPNNISSTPLLSSFISKEYLVSMQNSFGHILNRTEQRVLIESDYRTHQSNDINTLSWQRKKPV
ncbi:pentapeptide repeat-containing protein [Yersinia pseudotuberculosis]|uniref:pentapeptide repeat-containing protein n=1 Tax=Yersinia pseudotuberculosis TaxID=633 RepID=UPI001E37908D|nr:pentapeptide repeat-containing protein [Yersinia pseudotuberculosis]